LIGVVADLTNQPRFNVAETGDDMFVALELNLALWGMLVCAEIKLAQCIF